MLDTMWGLKDKVSFCEHKTEACTVEKTNIVAVEVYDMTLKQMAQALLSHKAKRFDFSLIIPPECATRCVMCTCLTIAYTLPITVTRLSTYTATLVRVIFMIERT